MIMTAGLEEPMVMIVPATATGTMIAANATNSQVRRWYLRRIGADGDGVDRPEPRGRPATLLAFVTARLWSHSETGVHRRSAFWRSTLTTIHTTTGVGGFTCAVSASRGEVTRRHSK
jgi:hypothetical protein